MLLTNAVHTCGSCGNCGQPLKWCKCGTTPWRPQAEATWPTIPSPRTMPVNMPFPQFGEVTIAILDKYGNVTIKTDQPEPEDI